VFVGQFFNQVLPTSFGGDAIRIWLIRRSGLPLGDAVKGILLDRIAALAVVVVSLILFLPGIYGIVADPTVFWSITAAVLVCGTGMVGMLIGRNIFLKLFANVRYLNIVLEFLRDYRKLFLSKETASILFFAAAIQFNYVFIIFQLALGMGIAAQFWQFLFIVPVVILTTALPVSFAGWGVREGAMVIMLGFVDVSTPQALALSITVGFLILASGLIGGVIWLSSSDKRAPPTRAF